MTNKHFYNQCNFCNYVFIFAPSRTTMPIFVSKNTNTRPSDRLIVYMHQRHWNVWHNSSIWILGIFYGKLVILLYETWSQAEVKDYQLHSRACRYNRQHKYVLH